MKEGVVKSICLSLISFSKVDICCDKWIIINIFGMRFEIFESILVRLLIFLFGLLIKKVFYYDFSYNEYYFDRNKYVFDSILFYY